MRLTDLALVLARDGGAGFITRIAGAVLERFILFLLIRFLIRNSEHLRPRTRLPDNHDDSLGPRR